MFEASRPPVAPSLTTPPRAHLSRWAARAGLLLACAASVATSEALSPLVTSEVFAGEPVTLTNQAPNFQRDLVIRVTASKSHARTVEPTALTKFTLRWLPEDPDETARPRFSFSLSTGNEVAGGRMQDTAPLAGEPITREHLTRLETTCKLEGPCEYTARVRFEMQAEGPKGSLQIDWTVVAGARVRGMSAVPEGFSVTVSAP
ncbi:hypothetical protein [Corallococcus silvisoli]|uniref:hypothetical protein n=1 Tax=Corallococcus silvisoli TaxID=2697031 RepID=UPI00137750CE|nr:hypothetical protein [Corallococcus silvisoli]NBD11781.1 hypothetical protein [Corallococcus silvisoli]